MWKHLVAIPLQISLVTAQSSTVMPSSASSLPESTSLASIPTATAPKPTSPFSDDGAWISRDGFYGAFTAAGMNPAAASYAVKEAYATDSNGNLRMMQNDRQIIDKIGSALTGDLVGNDEANRLSIQGYFVTLLPTSAWEYESSFISVWRSLESSTLNPSESVRLHSLFESYASKSASASASASRAQASATANQGVPAVPTGVGLMAMAGVLAGAAGGL